MAFLWNYYNGLLQYSGADIWGSPTDDTQLHSCHISPLGSKPAELEESVFPIMRGQHMCLLNGSGIHDKLAHEHGPHAHLV